MAGDTKNNKEDEDDLTIMVETKTGDPSEYSLSHAIAPFAFGAEERSEL